MAGELKEKYVLWKNLGETPLEALERLREEQRIDAEVPMTYAGRLDPAAEGFLLILAGEECKNKENYTLLPKTYMAEVLVGVSTDTYDLLGVPHLGISNVAGLLKKTEEFFESRVGVHTQAYPPYSSKTVDGIQLHEHARNGNEITTAEHEVELISFEDVTVEDILGEDVLTRVGEVAGLVTGNFRQKEIVEGWANVQLPEKMQLISVIVSVGSGFYIRQLAEDLGKYLGTGACLYSLIRTQIGEYSKVEY